MKRYVLALLFICLSVGVNADKEVDSLQTALIDSLQQQLQEMKLNEIVLQHALDKRGESERADSIAQANMRHRIDSLRNVTPGVPLVIGEDTLLYIHASIGGQSPEVRASNMKYTIEQLGKSLKLTTDSIFVFEGEHFSYIMCGEIELMRVSNLDGLWNNTDRHELAKKNMKIISQKINELHDEYGLTAKLRGFGWAILLIIIQIVLFLLTARFIRHLRERILSGLGGKLKPMVILQLFISLPLLFSIFPETEKFTWKMINYVWEPLEDIVVSFVHHFPNLVKIIVILYVLYWLLRVIRYYANEITKENIKIEGFYADWAQPTYQIIRIFVVAFSLIVIWPLLPGSESGIFKGVSIFVAALFSLGSTTTIGNLISGLIITYMRPFLVGDFVRIGDSEGIVVEKNAFITRLRDIKDNIITVPNNSILSMQTINYSAATRNSQGTIVHSDFTFTYKVPRQTIEQYLLEAADRCSLLLKEPRPYVLVTTLEDFYSRYEINGYTMESHRLFAVYSELHKNILDVFREHDLEPTSSHFVSVKENK